MADQTQTLKGLSESVAEHVASKLKLTPSFSLNSSILKELKNISSLLGSSISKNQSVSAGQYRIPSPTTTENYDSVSETPRQKKTLLERFRANNRQMLTGAVSKLIPESIKSRLNPTVKAEGDSPSIDSSKKQSGIVEKLLAKIASPASDKTKDSQTTPATAAPKSLLETRTEVQKVEVQNFKELSEIIPAAFKDYFKEINTNLKDIVNLLGSIEKKDFGGDGGKGGGLLGMLGSLAAGKGLMRMLKNTGVGRMVRKGNVLLKRTIPRAAKSLITKGKGAITGAAKGLGTIGTKVLKATGITAAGATIAKAADTAFTGAKDLGSKAVGAVKEKAGAALEGAKDLGSKAISSVKEKAPAIIKGVTEKAKAALEGAKDLGSKAMGAAGKAGTWVKGLLPGKAGGAIAEKVAESGAGKSVATKIATSLAKRIPKAMAGGVAKSIPFLGAAIGAGFAVSRLVQGDYVGAALEGVSGIGSAATAIPATVALMAKDVYQDVYGVAPENDPEAKTRMAEITDQTTKAATDFLKGAPEAKEKTEEKPKEAEATPPITPTPVKDAVADQTIKTKETPATPSTVSIPLEKPEQKFTPIAMDKVPEIAKESVSAAVEPPKATEPTKGSVLDLASGPSKEVNKEIAESPEYKAALEGQSKLQGVKADIQALKDTPSAQIAPAPETAPSAKPTEEAAPKGDKHLETIASNTNKTNDTLAGLTSGFAALAKALEKLGVSVASNPPTTINNIAGGGQQASQGPSPSALANAGNQDISNFRKSIVEASRFQAA